MKKKSLTKTKKSPPYVKVYFIGKNKSLAQLIEQMSEEYGMSSSAIGAMAIKLGLPFVKKNLDGLSLDIEVQAEYYESADTMMLRDK